MSFEFKSFENLEIFGFLAKVCKSSYLSSKNV